MRHIPRTDVNKRVSPLSESSMAPFTTQQSQFFHFSTSHGGCRTHSSGDFHRQNCPDGGTIGQTPLSCGQELLVGRKPDAIFCDQFPKHCRCCESCHGSTGKDLSRQHRLPRHSAHRRDEPIAFSATGIMVLANTGEGFEA